MKITKSDVIYIKDGIPNLFLPRTLTTRLLKMGHIKKIKDKEGEYQATNKFNLCVVV